MEQPEKERATVLNYRYLGQFVHKFYILPNLIVLMCCLSITPSLAAEQQSEPPRSAFSIRYENDFLSGKDGNYTNGMSLGLTRKGQGLLGGIWDLAGSIEGERFSTYELTQSMFTPLDLKRSDPDPSDRPYAGLLYLGSTTHLQRENSLHSLKLIAGVVGPASLAEEVQRDAHKVSGSTKPEGWDHQIKNEPVVNLFYEYRHKYRLTPRDAAVAVEVIPMGGAFLGNYLTLAEAEVQVRIGYQPDDFGASVLRGASYLPLPREDRTDHIWGFYVFAGGAADLVARNITLDGNSFANSRSVDKRLFLPAAEFGASLWTRLFQATFSYAVLGREFYGQPEREDLGSVLFSYYFR